MHLGGASDSLSGVKALPPILSYCSASIMMTVVNKVSASSEIRSIKHLV